MGTSVTTTRSGSATRAAITRVGLVVFVALNAMSEKGKFYNRDATSATADGPENAEDLFNEYSMDERGKFEEETLVNVNARKRASRTKNADGEENINEYILVTIIAACDGGLKLPAVTDGTELRTALKRVGAIRVDALQAVEVLWTPQEEGDTLSEDELLRDYPQLNVL